MSWDVFYKNKWIDSVWYTKDCTAEYVKQSLISHDGYPYDIVVRKAQ